jgi:queuosine biosynthesis protein QueD
LYEIEKKFTFEAAHVLKGLGENHPCSTIHGHSYKLYVKISSEELDRNGFIIDFGELKTFQKELIDSFIDHSVIITRDTVIDVNCSKVYIMPKEYTNTTVENMCKHFLDLLLEFFKDIKFDNFYKIRIKMFETENNSGSYTYIKN